MIIVMVRTTIMTAMVNAISHHWHVTFLLPHVVIPLYVYIHQNDVIAIQCIYVLERSYSAIR